MPEILKKNEIKAEMEMKKLLIQVIILTYFGLWLRSVDEFEKILKASWGNTTFWGVAFVLLLVSALVLKYGYMKKAKELDKEEAKERGLKT